MATTSAPATDRRMLIDGELVLASSERTFDVVGPATEEVIGQVADADAAEMGQNGHAGFRQYLELKSVAWPAA